MARFEPNFILDKSKSDKETYILLQISLPGRYRVSTKEKILPILWDNNTHRPTSNKKLIRSLSPFETKKMKYLSARLDEIEYQINDMILERKRDKALSPDDIKSDIDKIVGKEPEKEEKEEIRLSIVEYYLQLIDKMKSEKILTSKGTPYSVGTIKSHLTGRGYLVYYEEKFGPLYFEDINSDFKVNFIGIMNEKNFKINTISRAIGFIKFVCRQALDEGLHTNIYFQTSDFDVTEEDVDTIYLTHEELKALINITEFKVPGQELARDLFLIGCYTALRLSDYSRIIPQYINITENGTKVIDMITTKTKQRVVIPFLFPELDMLLSKYEYRSPKISDQKLNEYIKEVAELANITQDVVITETIGGERKESIYRKCDLITSHTARRTGATNLFKLGFSSLEIMKITGHTSEKTFLKYIKMSKIENADRMADKLKKLE